ncbi:hypothetical protein [Paenibacillus glycanilyticus]|uniref:hypothetical protein n=1 Tax=Paenibacillus glycanilyticus TaxID=126569 RepID=UPI001910EDCC|nr:hypothetical protein [Paenibacillus glycanilyticus]
MKLLSGVLMIALVIMLSACAGKGALNADGLSKAFQKQGLEVRELSSEEVKQLASTPVNINGVEPVTFELTLPAADMAHREFVFVYVFTSEKERIRMESLDGTPTPIKMNDLYPNVIRKKNLIVNYWSYNKDNPLLIKQISRAIDKL